MAASLYLLLTVILAFAGGDGPWVMAATVVLAAAAGTRLPDLDTPLRLGHRSALVHSVLPAAVALLDLRTWPVAAGLGLGIGLHLAADLFPGSMRGYATIKLPLGGSIGIWPSYGWIAVNAAANLVGGALLLERIVEPPFALAALAASGLVGFVYLVRAQGGWCAIALLAAVGWYFYR